MTDSAREREDRRRLLEKAALLNERHRAGRGAGFDIFTVLRDKHEEAHLHSAFLAALLDVRRTPCARANLEDFLKTFAPRGDFDLHGVEVEREREHIDIPISDSGKRWAVAIENKVRAGDQPRQLRRYCDGLKDEDFENVHLLYLTLDGRAPSEDSADDLDVDCVSYDKLLPWIDRCQQRACADPGLRESIAQYRQLVRELTAADWREGYGKDLKALCAEDDNLRVIDGLVEASAYAQVDLLFDVVEDLQECSTRIKVDALFEFCVEVERALKEKIGNDLRKAGNEAQYSTDRIDRYVRAEKHRNSGYFGLYYDIGGGYAGCSLAAQINGYEVYGEIVLGVQCAESKYRNTIYEIRDAMKGMHEDRKGKDGDEWLWIERLDPELLPENFRRDSTAFVEFLRDGERARKLVHRIAGELHRVWSALHEGEPRARSG